MEPFGKNLNQSSMRKMSGFEFAVAIGDSDAAGLDISNPLVMFI